MNEEHLARVQLTLKVKGKNSAVQMARTDVLLAPKQQLPPQTARTGVLHWLASISNSNRMRNICGNGARSEADLARLRRGDFLPTFFFRGCWCKFFFNAPL